MKNKKDENKKHNPFKSDHKNPFIIDDQWDSIIEKSFTKGNVLRDRTKEDKADYVQAAQIRGELAEVVHEFRRLNDNKGVLTMGEILDINLEEVEDITDKCTQLWKSLGKLNNKDLDNVYKESKKRGIITDPSNYIDNI
jgi:hypothetical protein